MGQQLKKISDHVWVYTFDSPKDRPNLGYIHGSRMSMAVDAGHWHIYRKQELLEEL